MQQIERSTHPYLCCFYVMSPNIVADKCYPKMFVHLYKILPLTVPTAVCSISERSPCIDLLQHPLTEDKQILKKTYQVLSPLEPDEICFHLTAFSKICALGQSWICLFTAISFDGAELYLLRYWKTLRLCELIGLFCSHILFVLHK